MSAAEALRTKLDQLQTQYNFIEAENRKLREERPQQAEAIDLEREIMDTRQENLQLSQTIATLEAKLEEQETLRKSIQSLTHEAEVRRAQMEKSAAELAASQEEVARAATRAESAEAYVGAMATELTDSKRETEELQKQAETAQKRARSLEEELERLRSKFELETLRAVAEETRKWEAREDRLTRRLDELEELRNREDRIRAAIWRAKRNKNQSATLRPLPRNIATWTAQYYAVGVTTSTPSYCREHFRGGNAIFISVTSLLITPTVCTVKCREILRGPTTPQYHGVTKYRVAPTKMLPAIRRGRRRNADRVILRGPCRNITG